MMSRVLLIDDEPELAKTLEYAFRMAGFDAEVASDGDLGLRAFRDSDFDAVVSEILMPNREGLETIFEMRRQAPGLAIIAMSGGGRIGANLIGDMALSMGADVFIQKPFRPSELVRLLTGKLDERNSVWPG